MADEARKQGSADLGLLSLLLTWYDCRGWTGDSGVFPILLVSSAYCSIPVLPVYDCSFNLGVTWASALIYLLVWRVSFSSWFLESNWGLSKVSISSCMVYWLNFSITFLRLSLLDCQIEIHWKFLMPLCLYNMERMLPCIEVVVC